MALRVKFGCTRIPWGENESLAARSTRSFGIATRRLCRISRIVNPQGYDLRNPKHCPAVWGHLSTLVAETQEMIWALSDRLLRSEQLLFALRIFFRTARLRRLPFCQELGQYFASGLHRKQRNESLDEEIVLRSFPSMKTWRYNSRNVSKPSTLPERNALP